MRISLIETHSYTFTWLGDVSNKGRVDKGGHWIQPIADVHTLISKGSLQPYQHGESLLVLPEGMREKESYLWYTKDVIRSLDDKEKLEPATTEINGATFEVVKHASWTGYKLISDHHLYLLVKQSPVI